MSFLQKGKLALESAGVVVGNLVTGEKVIVSEELARERLSVCATCPKLGKLIGKPKCTECGCFLTLKAQLEGMKCPLNKWAK
jgi:hypothetical protein